LLRAVFVDVGDTLVHLDRPWEEVFQTNLQALYNHLSKRGLSADSEKFAERFVRVFNDASSRADLFKIEIPMEEIISKAVKKFGLRLEGDMATRAMIDFFGPEIESWQTYPDTLQTLTELERSGYMMGVISNAKSDWAVNAILRRRELGRFFRTVVTSAALKIRKPRVEIFKRALDDLDVEPSDAVFIGDSVQADVSGAKNMGMYSIHVLRRPVEGSPLTRPDATVTSLAETPGIIAEWNNGLRKI
jgi:putative hydrolase of the HAD superfamily